MFHNLTLEQLHQMKILHKHKSQIQVTSCNGNPVLQIVDGNRTQHLHTTDFPEEACVQMDLLDVEMFTRVYLPTN